MLSNIILVTATFLIVTLIGLWIKRQFMKKGKLSIQNLAESFSNKSDQLITHTLDTNSNYTFVSGILKLIPDTKGETINVSINLYFLDEKKQWVEASTQEKVKFTALLDESIQELQLKQEVQYEINAPELNKNRAF